MQRHTSCEIAVIGGGYTGALIGYALTADGADVLLVDRRDFGMGSTAASTALIEYQLDSELYEFIELAGRPALPWAGAFAATKDGLGYVDESPTFPNAYFALGVGGNGMIFSVIAAGILRDLCRGKKNPDRHLFRFDRPGAINTNR